MPVRSGVDAVVCRVSLPPGREALFLFGFGIGETPARGRLMWTSAGDRSIQHVKSTCGTFSGVSADACEGISYYNQKSGSSM